MTAPAPYPHGPHPDQLTLEEPVITTEVTINASDIVLDDGDVMLRELSVGDPIEIARPTAGMQPGIWVITAFERDDRSRARVRRMSREEIQSARRAEAFARIYE